jgi:ribonuclease HI
MIYLNTDGGARGNPGPAGIGAVVRNSSEEITKALGKYIGIGTNNEAEYQALILGLSYLVNELKPTEEITCRLDSELVVKQLRGEYKVKNDRLLELHNMVKELAKRLTKVNYVHVRREQNKEADLIVNRVLDEQEQKAKA